MLCGCWHYDVLQTFGFVLHILWLNDGILRQDDFEVRCLEDTGFWLHDNKTLNQQNTTIVSNLQLTLADNWPDMKLGYLISQPKFSHVSMSKYFGGQLGVCWKERHFFTITFMFIHLLHFATTSVSRFKAQKKICISCK